MWQCVHLYCFGNDLFETIHPRGVGVIPYEFSHFKNEQRGLFAKKERGEEKHDLWHSAKSLIVLFFTSLPCF